MQLNMHFKGFGRYHSIDRVISKIGVNSFDSLVYSDPIITDYFRIKVKILKMKDKDASGLAIGLLQEDNLQYKLSNMTHIAIGGKGNKWVYNTDVKMDYRFKSKDKILLE